MEPVDRPTIEVSRAVGGWPRPWPAVAELAVVLPPHTWTIVGGLMTQLHTIINGFGVVRPTDDVDIVLHVETTRGLPDATASALRRIGYDLRDPIDPRDNTAHRFIRDGDVIDLVTSTSDDNAGGDSAEEGEDVVDVLIADHPAPRVTEKLPGAPHDPDRGWHPSAQTHDQCAAGDHPGHGHDHLGAETFRRRHLEGGRVPH